MAETYVDFKHKNKITKIIYDPTTKLIWTSSIDKTICSWTPVKKQDKKKIFLTLYFNKRTVFVRIYYLVIQNK